jgi:hypothetical protein
MTACDRSPALNYGDFQSANVGFRVLNADRQRLN